MPSIDRRTFLQSAALSAPLLSRLSHAQEDDAPRKANIVLIMADDLGYGDIGCYGCDDIQTPNIDRIAAQGVRLTDYYASAPVCTPTRCALMTGRYQARCPNLEWALYTGVNTVGLAPTETTIATMLNKAGFATGMFGKWHLGEREEWRPNQHGFDEFFGHLGGNLDYFQHRIANGERDLYENNEPIQRDGYITDLITARAVDFLERKKEAPFFAYVAYNAPHWPMQGPDDHDKKVVQGKNWIEKDRATYIRMVEQIDAGVGKILDQLKESGLEQNTLVVFCSDNGGDRSSRNTPLRGQKGHLWEGGIRVPCVMRWPGVLPAGGTNSQASITMDLSATLLSAAMVRPSRKLDGMDLLSYLTGYRNPVEQTLVWRNTFRNQRTVRWGKWKWLEIDGKEMLFDLKKDIGESEDILQRFPDIAHWLREIYGQWERAMPYKQTLFGDDLHNITSPDQGATL